MSDLALCIDDRAQAIANRWPGFSKILAELEIRALSKYNRQTVRTAMGWPEAMASFAKYRYPKSGASRRAV